MALVTTALTAPSAVAAPVAAAARPGTCEESGNYEVCFTYADNGTPDDLIARKIKAKIDATATTPGPDDYIRVAMYMWRVDGQGDEIASSLIRAAQNGVSVRVVLGGENTTIKNRFTAAGIDVQECVNACTGETGSMHNKFFLIQKGTTKLVLQTSTNLTDSQMKHAQNLLISRDDPELFSHYVNYWRRLYDRDWTWGGVTWGEEQRARAGTNDLSRAYFYPMPTKTPLVGVLQNVTACAAGNDRVWLEASLFDSSSFSAEVARELNRLRGIGCDVKVVLQKEPGRAQLENHGFPTSRIQCDGQHHNKLLLIDAFYASQWRKAVFVGSYNITQNSLRNSNDTMLRIINGWVVNRYINQFQELWTNPRACDAT
ncbi:phospholipase D-like domain-containing protein [Streptomyces sp. NPDC047315]|uniref:phospholipase D-like domain-containing protein n=1 Tax=Streptomyces sp. NPDC047315 TaxID=3155142 RepID=UPI0033FD270C